MWFRKQDQEFERLERSVKETVTQILNRALADTESVMAKLRSTFDLAKRVTELREELETLKIEKARKDEEFAKREREIEHKVGLERKRQEFELAQARRETAVTLREENLKADRDRFEAQMKFHEERFSQEVGYLKEMVGQMLVRLPSATVNTEIQIQKRRA